MSAPSAFRSVVRKARKSHKCCECNETITIGDQYQYSSGVWDGDPRSYKQCLRCGEIFEKLSHAGYDVCFTQLRDYLIDLDCKSQEWRVIVAEQIDVDSSAIAQLLKVEVGV